MNEKIKQKIMHSQLYKTVLWVTIIAFACVTLVTVFAIILDGFTAFTGKMLFIMWQAFWFGILAILFCRFYERNTFVVSRSIAIAAIISCVLLLLIGIWQAFFPEQGRYLYSYASNRDAAHVLVDKVKWILSIFVYASIVIEWHLKVTSDVKAVILARNITAGIMMGAMLILDVMILADADELELSARLIVAISILAIVGVIITRILAAIYNKNTKPTASRQVTETTMSPQQHHTAKPESAAMSVNREYLIQKMQEITNKNAEECMAIANVFENGLLLGKQSKEELVGALMANLAMSEQEAGKIYDEYISTMMSEFLKR